mgnify:CR=1 FL=1
MSSKFDDIAPLYDHEVEQIIQELLVDPGFKHAVNYIMPDINWDDFSKEMSTYKTKEDFQRKMIYPVVSWLGKSCSTSIRTENWENLSKTEQHVILSNHRDIVLDAGLLNIKRFEHDFNTTEIAIGDNLLIHPWIDKLVRLNKSFIVKRGCSIKEQLLSSKHLSEYIYYNINEKGESVWIAQREGRAKDSNDRTQDSLLKMLTLHGTKETFIENLQSLNLVPLSISYEYDPCDYLKAREFQLKRDNPEYKKTERDDLLNMEIGILGQKGDIVFRFGKCINDKLGQITETEKRLQVEQAAKIIDQEIHSNYEIFPGNYVAHDLLNNEKRFAGTKYTPEQADHFTSYVKKQLAKIDDVENKDEDFLYEKMLIMYSNTLKNHLIATGK